MDRHASVLSNSNSSKKSGNSRNSASPSVEKKKIEELTPEEIAHRERKAQRKEEVTREHDKIINEIEQSDQTCIGTALKNVYTLGHVGRFQKKLEKRIRHQEREIERMCAFHYSHFVDAIEELSSIQGDAFNLCKQVSDTNINLQSVGNEIKDRHKELLRYRRQQTNINKVVQQLNECLPILIMFKRIKQLMSKGKYYSTLKLMEQIEHTHLSHVEQFKFAKTIQAQFPIIKDQVLRTSQDELKDFLENIQVNSPKVGTAVLRKYLLKRKPDLDEDHPLISDPTPVKKMGTFSVAPPKVMATQSRRSLTESAQDLARQNAKNPFGEEESESDENNPFDESSDDADNPFHSDNEETNPFGKEEDNNPFAEESNANPFGEPETNPFGSEASEVPSPQPETVNDPNPFEEQFSEMSDGEEPSIFETLAKETKDQNLDNDVYDFVEFHPVHKCLHIHSLVGGIDDFVEIYRRERQHQAKLLFTAPKDISNFPLVYRNFLHQILGFFAIEDVLLNSSEHLVSKSWLERLLQSGVSRVLMLLRSQLAYSDDCTDLLQSKELTVAFSDALSSYGFTRGVKDLNAVLPEMWRQYIEGLLKKYAAEFLHTLLTDQFYPIVVRAPEDEAKYQNFRYAKKILKKQSKFPKSLQFSKQVCDIHFLLQKFIKNAYSYAMDLEVDGNICVDSLLAKSVETLLQRNLREAMDKSISERIRSLDNAIQFIINLDHLDKSIKDVESYIKDLDVAKAKKGKARKRMSEVGSQVFADLRRQAEQVINPMINEKLDEKLSQPFNFQMKESLGKTSPYLIDAFKFLEEAFTKLKGLNMSNELIQEAVFATYQHVGFTLLGKRLKY